MNFNNNSNNNIPSSYGNNNNQYLGATPNIKQVIAPQNTYNMNENVFWHQTTPLLQQPRVISNIMITNQHSDTNVNNFSSVNNYLQNQIIIPQTQCVINQPVIAQSIFNQHKLPSQQAQSECQQQLQQQQQSQLQPQLQPQQQAQHHQQQPSVNHSQKHIDQHIQQEQSMAQLLLQGSQQQLNINLSLQQVSQCRDVSQAQVVVQQPILTEYQVQTKLIMDRHPPQELLQMQNFPNDQLQYQQQQRQQQIQSVQQKQQNLPQIHSEQVQQQTQNLSHEQHQDTQQQKIPHHQMLFVDPLQLSVEETMDSEQPVIQDASNHENIENSSNVNTKHINELVINKTFKIRKKYKLRRKHGNGIQNDNIFKKHRRIVLPQDDSSNDEDIEKNRLNDLTTVSLTPSSPLLASSSSPPPNFLQEIEELENIIDHEKPGPKSRKQSTQFIKQLQAKTLLQNAVVIRASDKKHTNRLSDSDDDVPEHLSNVDDIGLAEDNNDFTISSDNILINENDTLTIDSIAIDKVEKIITFENPILPQHNDLDESTTTMQDLNIHNDAGTSADVDKITSENESGSDLISNSSKLSNPLLELNDNLSDQSKNMHINNKKTRSESTSTSSWSASSFESSGSSSSEDELKRNKKLMKQMDKNSHTRGSRGRPRGRPTLASQKNYIKPLKNKKSLRGTRGTIRGRPPLTAKLNPSSRCIIGTDSSDSNSSISDSDSEHSKNEKNISHKNKSRNIPNEIYFGDVEVPLHVLHSYTSSGTHSTSSSSDNEPEIKKLHQTTISNKINQQEEHINLGNNSNRMQQSDLSCTKCGDIYKNISTPKVVAGTTIQYETTTIPRRGRPPCTTSTTTGSMASQSGEKLIMKMKKYLKVAGIKKVKFYKLWEGCKTQQERADKILELLREKGLQGEPTISKCRELKTEILTQREADDLDPNLIIQSEGRTTRRSGGNVSTNRINSIYEEHAQETIQKLRKLIDSDSDFD